MNVDRARRFSGKLLLKESQAYMPTPHGERLLKGLFLLKELIREDKIRIE
jgi:hypothetical protein